MTVLTIGLVFVVFAVAGLAIDGTRVFLVRRALQSAADAAVVAAAAEIDTTAYYRSGGSKVQIDPRRAERAAGALMEQRGIEATARLRGDGDGVEIALTSEVQTTWLRLVGIGAIPVAASSRAEPFPQRVAPGTAGS